MLQSGQVVGMQPCMKDILLKILPLESNTK